MNKKFEDLTEEEIRKMGQDFLDQREEMRLANQRCKIIQEQFEANELPDVKPLWHLKKYEIDFSLQTEQLDDELMIDGCTLIKSVDIEKLLDSMQEGNPELYREKELFHVEWSDYRICKVIEHWVAGIKLIPPTIILNENLGLTYVADGKHRFNVAYCFGATEIPIVVPNIHLTEIKSLIH